MAKGSSSSSKGSTSSTSSTRATSSTSSTRATSSTSSTPRAPDPVRVASVTPSYTPPTISSVPGAWASSPVSTSRLPSAFDVTPQSLIDSRRDYEPGYSSSPGRVVADEPAKDNPTVAPDPVKKKISNSTLRLSPVASPRANSPRQSGRTNSSPRTSKTSSPETAREALHCKKRPTDNTPKGGGGGGSFRRFIPWCG